MRVRAKTTICGPFGTIPAGKEGDVPDKEMAEALVDAGAVEEVEVEDDEKPKSRKRGGRKKGGKKTETADAPSPETPEE